MSAPTRPASPVEPPERTPAGIRAELPEDVVGRFDAEDKAALDAASASYRLDQRNEVSRRDANNPPLSLPSLNEPL